MEWLGTLAVGAIGALIGTYCGAYFLNRRTEEKTERIREIAVRALKIIKNYARQSYKDAVSQFNTELNISEKRAVIVALHKLGVPIEVSTKDVFDIKKIKFYDKQIAADEIDDMIGQISRGHCDNLFFMDVESYFSANLRIRAVREVGKKYVNEVLKHSTINMQEQKIKYPYEWDKKFTPGEIQAVLVLIARVNNSDYFKGDGNPDNDKIDVLIKEIEIGLWDNYLFWDYDSYQNMRSQNSLATIVQAVVLGQIAPNSQNTQQVIINNAVEVMEETKEK